MPKMLTFTVKFKDGTQTRQDVEVAEIFNFGYAGRDQERVRAHLKEMADLAPVPNTIPAIFPLPSDMISSPGTIEVSGHDTYGEVEFALVFTGIEWLVTIGSDHSDAGVEKFSTPRAKACCPDMVSRDAWRLEEVLPHWDFLVMRLEASDGAESEVVQEGSLAELLEPKVLLDILEQRKQGPILPGTVVFSGTIGGAPRPGFSRWSASLGVPGEGNDLVLKYAVKALPDEL